MVLEGMLMRMRGGFIDEILDFKVVIVKGN